MISFSYDSIAEVVLARVALRHHLHPERPSMLTRDHREAVDLLIEGAFSAACLAMIPFIGDFNVAAADRLLTMELDVSTLPEPGAPREGEVRVALEAAIASYVMSRAFAGVDDGYAAELHAEYSALIDRARSICGASIPSVLRPCWY